MKNNPNNKTATYKDAGVNLEESQLVKDNIKNLANKTYNSSVLGGVGGFGAMFKLKDYDNPILVSSTDPVGTKLMVAKLANDFSNIGIDLVNACVNDIIVLGADPLFFLDYIATSNIDNKIVQTIVEGIANTCREINCALIGGETSEMPGVFKKGNFDISGFIVGAVEEELMLTPNTTVSPGDVLIALPSDGLHTNGYSLVRHVYGLDDNPKPLFDHVDELGETFGEALLRPHLSYHKNILSVTQLIKGVAHVTGGGIYENLPRVLPKRMSAIIDASLWETPPLFDLIQTKGDININEMYRVYNMGIGMILISDKDNVSEILNILDESFIIGEVVPKDEQHLIKIINE